MIKTITSYQTEDGQCFPTMEEAESHQACAAIILEMKEVVANSADHYSDIAAWILRNFTRKESASHFICDTSGTRYKVKGRKVWVMIGGVWDISLRTPEEMIALVTAGKMSPFKAE